RGNPAARRERLRQTAAVRIAQRELLRSQPARDRATADAAEAEIVRLLAQEVDHAKVVLQPAAAFGDAACSLDGPKHTDRAVEPPAARNRVGVRTGNESRTALCPGQRADEVACRVALDLQPGIAHP